MKTGMANRSCAIIAAAVLLLSGSAGCGRKSGQESRCAVAGIPPVAALAQRIAGDRFQVVSILPEGRSPHDSEPDPQAVRTAVLARLFFSCGMPFEERLLREIPPERRVDVSRGTEAVPFDGAEATDPHHHGGSGLHDQGHHHEHHSSSNDPHVWLSVSNLRIMARNLAGAFAAADPENASRFRENLAKLEQELGSLERQIRSELAPYRGRSFFVYHPAFGHFSRMTGLRQVAVETGGRDPDPVHLKELIRKAREEQVKVIFVQPQFNPGTARALANAIGGKVVPLDPLAPDVPENLRNMTKILKGALERK